VVFSRQIPNQQIFLRMRAAGPSQPTPCTQCIPSVSPSISRCRAGPQLKYRINSVRSCSPTGAALRAASRLQRFCFFLAVCFVWVLCFFGVIFRFFVCNRHFFLGGVVVPRDCTLLRVRPASNLHATAELSCPRAPGGLQ